MKRILKALFAFGMETICLPISILIWIIALAQAVRCNGLNKEEWKHDLQFAKNTIVDLWKFKIAWINL